MSEKGVAFVLILLALDLSSGNAPSRKYATIVVCKSSISATTTMVNSNSILGFLTYPTGIVHRELGSDVKPRLAKASA